MPTQLYLTESTQQVYVPEGEHYRINAQPDAEYQTIDYTLFDTQGTLAFGTKELGLNARITLPDSGDYTFAFNSATGQVDIALADGHVLARLPVDSEGATAQVRLSDGYYTALQVDYDTLAVTPSADEMLGDSPTEAPTEAPTEEPTPEPTDAPTDEPAEPPQEGAFTAAGNNSEPLPWTLLFAGSDNQTGNQQLYVSDGTAEGTYTFFADARSISISDMQQPADNSSLYFYGNVWDSNWHSQYGWYRLDLATQSQQYLGEDYDYNAEHGDESNSQALFNGDFSYVARETGPYGRELYRKEQDDAGDTTYSLIKDINPGSSSSLDWYNDLSDAALLPNGTLLFAADDGSENYWDEPWVSDGTQAGTFALSDAREWESIRSPSQFTLLGDEVAFSARVEGSVNGRAQYYGTELVFSDGTQSGTRVLDIHHDGASSSPQILGAIDETLYFTAENPGGRGIYRSDGESFTLLADIVNNAQLLGWSDEIAYFNVATSEYGNELWAADLTGDDGFYLVKDILPGSGASLSTSNRNTTMLDNHIVFTAYTSDTQQSLMISDGSDEGTRIITTFEGEAPYDAILAASDNQLLYFSGDTIMAHDTADSASASQPVLDDIVQWQAVDDGEAIYATRPRNDDEQQLWLIDVGTAEVTLVGGIDGDLALHSATAIPTDSIA